MQFCIFSVKKGRTPVITASFDLHESMCNITIIQVCDFKVILDFNHILGWIKSCDIR